MESQVASAKPAVSSGKHLSFMLGEEVYAIDIARVRQIVAMSPITPVPQTPAFISGVINLRGKIVPVVDLRVKFAMTRGEFTRNTCIIIVEVPADGKPIWLGIIVDSMCEVFEVKPEEVGAVPSFGIRVDTSFLLGIIHGNNSVRLLLDIEKVLSHEELCVTRQAQAAAASGKDQV